ncbi:MAG: hypothetical protein HY046_01650 [Acidobacteria bacterium]|nr:hypothetical protein [Acidobacteriota bacterium]
MKIGVAPGKASRAILTAWSGMNGADPVVGDGVKLNCAGWVPVSLYANSTSSCSVMNIPVAESSNRIMNENIPTEL